MKCVSPSPQSGGELLELYYLDLRMHVLEAAAALDRIAAAGGADDDPRLAKLRAGAQLLLDAQPDRARRFLELLSEGRRYFKTGSRPSSGGQRRRHPSSALFIEPPSRQTKLRASSTNTGSSARGRAAPKVHHTRANTDARY